jgi:P-type Cu+ transporter
MVIDPVCGMEIDPKEAAGKSEYQGKTYYFCSTGCKKSFDKDPQKYISHPGSEPMGKTD